MQVFIYCKITLHVSGANRTHHQEYTPDDVCDGHPKYLE